jgi:hypothetical protein
MAGVSVSPLPRFGDVFAGRDVDGRMLRISAHPERGRVVLSIWQADVCCATVRVALEDVGDLVQALTAAVAEATGGRSRPAGVAEERPA